MLITLLAGVTLARHGMHSNAGALEREKIGKRYNEKCWRVGTRFKLLFVIKTE
jgi:hypothetical protein